MKYKLTLYIDCRYICTMNTAHLFIFTSMLVFFLVVVIMAIVTLFNLVISKAMVVMVRLSHLVQITI